MKHNIWRLSCMNKEKEAVTVIGVFDTKARLLEWFKDTGFWPVRKTVADEDDDDDDDFAPGEKYIYATSEEDANKKGFFTKEPSKGDTKVTYDCSEGSIMFLAENIQMDTVYLYRYK